MRGTVHVDEPFAALQTCICIFEDVDRPYIQQPWRVYVFRKPGKLVKLVVRVSAYVDFVLVRQPLQPVQLNLDVLPRADGRYVASVDDYVAHWHVRVLVERVRHADYSNWRIYDHRRELTDVCIQESTVNDPYDCFKRPQEQLVERTGFVEGGVSADSNPLQKGV